MVHRGARVVALEPQASLARDLAEHFPEVTVLSAAVGDQCGTAVMHTSSAHSELSTLNEAWANDADEIGAAWDCRQTVRVTTLDELIARFGRPELVKIDTEGYEDRVLAGISQPVRQVLFEVHASLREVAASAFEHLGRLGHYEYRVMERESWILGPCTTADAVMSSLPSWGDVYARQVR